MEKNTTLKSFYVKHKGTFNFILKFALLLAVLNICYYGYVGLVDRKGFYYSSFLASFSLLDLITQCIIYPVKWILTMLGYHVRNFQNLIYIMNSPGVLIAFPCLGIGMMITVLSYIISYPLRREKIKFILIGILSIHLINIARIFTIVIVSFHYPSQRANTHDYFNYIAWVMIFGVLYFYSNHPPLRGRMGDPYNAAK